MVRTGQVLEKVIHATEALQGFLTVSRFLDESQKKAVEEILVACAKEANTKVDDELFAKGRSLPDSECGKQPTVREEARPHLAKTPRKAQ
ncbi:MAG TPA: hypothetical protein VEU33_40970, partial [Archangium sp.]|nr:hypothetical protein [Archangium sp.]